jgi:hypothetical protein
MSSIDLKLHFPTSASCADFKALLENSSVQGGEFSIAIADSKLHSENELLTLLITFMENGGVQAITAFLQLVRQILKQTSERRSVKITSGRKGGEISSNTTDDEIAKIGRDLFP